MHEDGYSQTLTSRNERLRLCTDNQNKYSLRIKEIVQEISQMSKLPESLDDWITSWSTKKYISLSEVAKRSKIRREYLKLVEDAESNAREMKMIAIDNLLDKIKITLEQ